MEMNRLVKVSAKMANLRFNGCEPDYIRDVCHARCCESSTAPTGTMITIHPTEQRQIEKAGGVVKDGMLQPKSGCRKCPFKTESHLCGLHNTPAKPFGCIASPFTLNATNTLIVRNRYRLLKCYNDGKRIPAFAAFRASLDLIFGKAESERVCEHLKSGGGDITASVEEEQFNMLKDNDAIKHIAKKKGLARCYGQDLMRGEHKVGQNDRLLLPPSSDTDFYIQKRAKEKELGRKLTTQEFYEHYQPSGAENTGTSIFDPVICELVYRWFCPPRSAILDPFAGGSVRGIVASVLGHRYHGNDLSERQVNANRAQAKAICRKPMPVWTVGDSQKLKTEKPVDLIFSCPPYFDLEVYSDDAKDLSVMKWEDFLKVYYAIIARCCGLLKPNRFACFVIGDVRDKQGFYRNLPGETIEAFRRAGLKLYNDAILVTAVGSLPIRIGRQFEGGRKLGTTHQRVLVFFKGEPKAIKEWPLPEFDKISLANASGADRPDGDEQT